MFGGVFWDDADSAIGVDICERSLGMQQDGGTYMPAVALVEATKKQMDKGRHGGGSAVQAAMQALHSATQPSDVCNQHLKLESCKGYRKVLQEGLVTAEKEQQQQQQQQQEASTSNKHHATGQLTAGLFTQDDGSLPPIVEHINFWHMGAKKDFPVLAGVAVRLLCIHSTACTSERNRSAWGQLHTKHLSRLAREHARKLIYVRCNSKQFILRRMTWKLACSCMRRRTNSTDDRGGVGYVKDRGERDNV
eukprot:1144940-Pelagomonas_calceolata.AAC.4